MGRWRGRAGRPRPGRSWPAQSRWKQRVSNPERADEPRPRRDRIRTMPQPAPFPFNTLSSSSPPILDEAMRKLAFQRTANVLRELDQIRRKLKLPLERVLEVYGASSREVASEKEQEDRAARTLRVPMTMSSRDQMYQPLRIKPGMIAQVIEHPQWPSYRVEEIEITGDPARWCVHGLQVGNHSQSPRLFKPPIPGKCFRKGGLMSELRLDTCQISTHFIMTVEYVGPLAEGEIFEAALVGTAVR